VVTLTGVLKAGCGYLALNPDDPHARLDKLITDAGTRLVLTDAALASQVPGSAASAVISAGHLARPGSAPPSGRAAADQLAYLCYTSGSTGAPKGVAVTHRGVVRLVHQPNWICIRPEDVLLQVSPPSFDAATLEIFGALANGSRLVILDGTGPVDVGLLAETVREQRVTVLILVMGLLHQLITTALPVFGSVRHVVAGGEAASPELITRLLRAHPGLLFTNGYGPTENTTFTTCWTSRVPPAGGTVPIGTAVNRTSVALLDQELRPVPAGEVGEIYASGAGLARGYAGQPARTAERFLPDPGGPPGTRMYQTGDLGRLLPSSDLEFTGRTDEQVKIQSYRVEPSEVRCALERRPGVSQAAVVVRRDDQGRNRLVAHVVPAGPDADPGLAPRLRAELRSELPGYMVPALILEHSALPLTAHGKVDYDALRAAEAKTRNVPNEFIAPGTEIERHIAGLWAALLGVEPVGVDDDFFDLGGHSLLATELLDTLRREFRVEVPAQTLYLKPTVAELSAAVSALVAHDTGEGGREA
jgi:amino acid adenylation domain-containing protein